MKKNYSKRETQAKETKEKLLSTSIKLIVKHGYNNISVSKICSECNVAKGTFYVYFDSKEDILIEILADVNRKMFNNHNWNADISPKDQLLEYASVYIDTIKNQGVEFTREILKLIMGEKFDPIAVESIKHKEHVERILKKAKETNQLIDTIEISEIQRYFQNFVYGLMVEWCSNDENINLKDYGYKAVSNVIDLFFI